MQENEDTLQDLMGTNYDNALLNWDVLLDTQTDLLLPYELQFFFSSPEWRAAQHVLDVGCGNGYYLTKLQAYFQNKAYTGVDKSSELIQLAQANNLSNTIDFIYNDFFNHKPARLYDAVLFRLTVQHMNCMKSIFTKASEITSDQASIIIIEPEPEFTMTFPPTPLFLGTLQAIERTSAQLNKNRGSLDKISDCLGNLPDWEVRNDRIIIIPQTGPMTNSNFLHMFLLWIDIFEDSKSFEYDFKAVREELYHWAAKETSYTQIAMRIYHLEKI